MAIGLKGSLKELKGCTLRYKLKEIKWNLKYAWQRAWRGYDSRDMFNMDIMFVERYKAILKDYKDHHWGLFHVPEGYEDYFDDFSLSEEQTDTIIDMMVYHLEMMDEDYVEKVLYGKNIYDDDYDFDKDHSFEKTKRIRSIVNQNKNAFMKLFTIFFWDLWD